MDKRRSELLLEDDEEERWVLAGLVVDSRSRRWAWKSFVVEEPACYRLRVVGHAGGRVRIYELTLGWTPSDDPSSERSRAPRSHESSRRSTSKR